LRLRLRVLLIVCALSIWFSLLRLSFASPGDAEVTRTKNLQYFQLEPGNVDVTTYRNLQYFELEPNNVDVIRLRNLQYFELEPNNADAIRYRNMQYFQLEPNDADITRLKNLQYFELVPVGDLVINIGPITTTDQDGNPKTTFNKGDIVQFEFVVENAGSLQLTRGLISAMILDSSDTPVFLSYTIEDLASGTSKKFIMGYGLPLDSLAGTYTIKVMVFTDWPSKGGVGLDIETTTFNVT